MGIAKPLHVAELGIKRGHPDGPEFFNQTLKTFAVRVRFSISLAANGETEAKMTCLVPCMHEDCGSDAVAGFEPMPKRPIVCSFSSTTPPAAWTKKRDKPRRLSDVTFRPLLLTNNHSPFKTMRTCASSPSDASSAFCASSAR